MKIGIIVVLVVLFGAGCGSCVDPGYAQEQAKAFLAENKMDCKPTCSTVTGTSGVGWKCLATCKNRVLILNCDTSCVMAGSFDVEGECPDADCSACTNEE